MIKYLREQFMDTHPDTEVSVIADNMILTKEKSCLMKWDDDKELLMVLQSNDAHIAAEKRPVQFLAIPYENIQYMTGDFPIMLSYNAATKMGFDADKSKAIIDDLDYSKNLQKFL